MILCADSLPPCDDAERHFKKQLFGPLLQPFEDLTPEGKHFEGIRA